MIVIKKGKNPQKLLDNVRALKATPDAVVCFDSLETETKKAIRFQLLEEQGYLCAYCMRRIGENPGASFVKIEHRLAQHPQRGGADQDSVDYRNMFAVCEGGKGQRHALQTCDTHKGNKSLTVDPLDVRTIDEIAYRSDGRIYSKNPLIDQDVDKTLNLNCSRSSLRQGRKAALDALNRKLSSDVKRRGPQAYRHYCEKELSRLQASVDKKQEYVGVIVWFLKRKINRHSS